MRSSSLVPSPIGELLVVAEDDAIVGLWLPAGRARAPAARLGPCDEAPPLAAVRDQLAEYFAGRRTVFELPLAPAGTAFQRRVWAAVVAIPFGATVSYGALARALGSPGGARAVGSANASNPISIAIACHRLVGSDGSLTGYGGGLAAKRWLLDHESRTAARAGAGVSPS